MNMKVEIYTQQFCGYCQSAKNLLQKKNINYSEYDISFDNEKRKQLGQKLGKAHFTTPQIFIGEKSIGGCDELYQLEKENKLDRMLKG